MAIALSKSIVAVDFHQNGLTPKVCKSIMKIISINESLIQFNLGSIKGANRNRLGRDGGLGVALGLSQGRSLIQQLSLRSTTLGNEEIEAIAEALEDNLFVTHLDFAMNRIEGSRGGQALAKILMRQNQIKGGENIQDIVLAHNRLGPSGFQILSVALLSPGV